MEECDNSKWKNARRKWSLHKGGGLRQNSLPDIRLEIITKFVVINPIVEFKRLAMYYELCEFSEYSWILMNTHEYKTKQNHSGDATNIKVVWSCDRNEFNFKIKHDLLYALNY